ncbi:MAG: mannonate dehydratase [Clostridia bacterium]
MKVGMGIREDNRLNKDYLQFVKQIGASHAVVFMPDKQILPSCESAPWSVDELLSLKKFYNENGLQLEGFENFDPRRYYKVLLGMPGKEPHMDYIKYCVQNMGKAGIPVMGYNFSLAGVEGHIQGPYSRGGAKTVRFSVDEAPIDEPIPLGTVFKRVVMPDAPKGGLPDVSLEEITQRYDWFLSQILPVAEEAGVKMCAHPDDPPVPVMRRTARRLINTAAYDEMFAKFPSTSNCVEFCQGTFGEMGVDVYDTIRHFCKQDKIGYVHFRNITGTIPAYTEVFIDEGDMDMVESLKVYKECGYKGLLMPDHTPLVNSLNPTETGMAYAIGYIRGIMKTLDIEIDE